VIQSWICHAVLKLAESGEVGDGYITRAIQRFIAKNPWIAARMKVTKKGYSMRFSLSEVA
jgi:hypothetical protein